MKDAVSFHVINEFLKKKPIIHGHQFFKQGYVMPESKHKILSCNIRDKRSDEPFKGNCSNTMLMYAKAIKDIREFIRWVQFDTDNEESLVE